MSRREQLGLLQKALATGMNLVNERTAGYKAPFIEEAFQSLGTQGFFRWAGQVTQVVKRLEAEYGGAHAQHIIAFTALWNGCEFCSVGHLYTGNLLLFAETGALFPIAETEVPRLRQLTDDEGLAELRTRLGGTQHGLLLQLLERVYALKAGTADESSPDTPVLRAAISAWDWTNECSISTLGIRDVPALTEINKDTALKERYRAAREQAARAQR